MGDPIGYQYVWRSTKGVATTHYSLKGAS
jgi:hypothetical protein